MSACEWVGLPVEVAQASDIDWGVLIDAFLVDAARVGNRYTAVVYRDHSGASCDGMTVITPEVFAVGEKEGCTLLRSLTGRDHYVIVSQLAEGLNVGDDSAIGTRAAGLNC